MTVKWGGRGPGHTSRITFPGEFAGGGEPEAPAATAPVLTLTSAAGTNPPSWSSQYTDVIVGSDYLCCRWRVDGGAWTNETSVLIDSDFVFDYGVDGASYPWPLFSAATFNDGELVEVQEGILRDAVTAWSNTLSDTIGGAPLTVLVAEGDSITAAASSYAEVWAAANPSVTFANEAVGGSGVGSMNARLSTTMANNPSHLTVLIGANDLMEAASAADYAASIYAYVAAAKAIKSDVVVGVAGILPIDESAAANAGKTGFNARRAEVNSLLRAAVGTEIDFYIPLGDHPLMDDAAMEEGGTYSTDGLHLNQTGAYGPITAVYSAVMDSILQQDSGTSPDAFTFSDVTGATTSTVYEDDVIVTGLAMGTTAAASMTGSGDMKRGHGSYGTTGFDVMNGDLVTRRVTSSASTGVEVTGPLTIGSTSDTFNVSTAAASITRPADVVAWYSPQDTASMAQTNTGTGSVGTDGDPVGTLNDKSGAGLHLTSTANGSTRPTFHDVGGLKYLTGDGVDDALRRLSVALPIGLGDTFTIAAAVKANPGTSRILFGSRGSDSGNPARCPLVSSSTAANGSMFYRDDAGATLATGGEINTNRYTNLWDNALRVVMLVVSAGTATLYQDGVAGTSWSVSEGALDFTDTYNLGLFAGFGAVATNFFAADLFELAVWDVALDGTERAAELTRLGALQGRTL